MYSIKTFNCFPYEWSCGVINLSRSLKICESCITIFFSIIFYISFRPTQIRFKLISMFLLECDIILIYSLDLIENYLSYYDIWVLAGS